MAVNDAKFRSNEIVMSKRNVIAQNSAENVRFLLSYLCTTNRTQRLEIRT
jgi:hypothetical protein